MILDSSGNVYTSSVDVAYINKITPNADKSSGTLEVFANLNIIGLNLVIDSKDNLYVAGGEDSKNL